MIDKDSSGLRMMHKRPPGPCSSSLLIWQAPEYTRKMFAIKNTSFSLSLLLQDGLAGT